MPLATDATVRRPEQPTEPEAPSAPRGDATVRAVVFGHRPDRMLLGGLIGYGALLTAWLASGRETSAVVRGASALLLLPLVLAAVTLALHASRELALDRGTRRFWRIAAAAIALLPIELFRDVLGGANWPIGLAGPLTLAGPLLFLAAMCCLPSAPRRGIDRLRLALDVVTVAAGGALLTWYTVSETTLSDVARARYALLHVEAVLDVVVIVVLAAFWRRTVLQHRANVLVLLAGVFVVQFFGHVAAAAIQQDGAIGVMQVVSPVAMVMLAAAGWLASATVLHRELRPVSKRVDLATTAIPFAAALPGVVLLTRHVLDESSPSLTVLLLGALVLMGLAFARQWAVTREAVSLLTESAARENEARFRALVQHSSDVIIIADPDGTIRYVSPSMATVFGHDPARLSGTSLFDLLHDNDRKVAQAFLAELTRVQYRPEAASPGVLKREWRLRHASGGWMTVDNVGTNLMSEPVINGLVLNTRDVTEQSQIKQQYMHQAFHDPLTDLANRSLFLYQVGHALARSMRHGNHVAVLFLDLDNFKNVNDSLGHVVGDRLLVDAARRLSLCVRDTDLIARLGGDEFAVLVEDCANDEDVFVVADRIHTALQRPFTLSGKEVFVNASIGIARASQGESSDDVVRNADVAMYVAKTRGKGQVAMFEPAMHKAALDRLVVEAGLRMAIDREEFFLQYQPIVELTTGQIIGAEALVRWISRDRGLVSPMTFIPIAEETGLIVPLGRWVLRRACREAQKWTRERNQALRITVNLSGRQLQDAAIVEDVASALEESGLDPSQLTLEITESMLMQHTDVSMTRLTALKALGVSLAIDDFGTGYSSLSYLQRYPVDILKIDKAFVDVIDKGGDGPVLASAIVALGETLRMNTVAEGIETEAQRAHLISLGCELGQGYLFSRPVDAEDFWELLATRGAKAPFVARSKYAA
ncbi:MAG: EAL domain-containing protein [Gemmatimonadaceae bacterium]|nr:EAL domain-containing protein [Gemmatimonadaceae bacterium]